MTECKQEYSAQASKTQANKDIAQTTRDCAQGERPRTMVALCGANGNMGREMTARLLSSDTHTLACAVDVDLPHLDCACYQHTKDIKESVDVIVDFSHHSAISALLEFALLHGTPLVIATTGHLQCEIDMIKRASCHIPIFFCGNMSVGIATLARIAQQVVQVFPHADIEIVETHHSLKNDVPSGTALMLANSINSVRKSSIVVGRHANGRRQVDEIGISSLRLGCDIGKHEIHIDTGCERITLQHQAYSRALYVDGAFCAIDYILTKKRGLFDMQDLLNNV